MLFTQSYPLARDLQYGCRRVHYITWKSVLDVRYSQLLRGSNDGYARFIFFLLPAYFSTNSKESSKLGTINFHSLCSLRNKRLLFFFEFPLCTFTLIHPALHILFTTLTLLCRLNLPDTLLCFCSAAQLSEKNKVLYDNITHTVSLIMWSCSCLRLCSLCRWLPLTPLPHPSPEYHSDPLGASDRDLCHPDCIFLPLLCCLRFIPGSALLPKKEKNQRLRQSGEIST